MILMFEVQVFILHPRYLWFGVWVGCVDLDTVAQSPDIYDNISGAMGRSRHCILWFGSP